MFRRILPITLAFSILLPMTSHAVWIWTPETGKFINPKMAVKSTPKLQLEYGLVFYNNKDYAKAISEFKKLIKNFPRAKEAPEAQYYIGQSYEELSKPFDAFKAYQVVIDKYPFSERAAEIVEIQYQIGNALLEGKGRHGKWAELVIGADDRVVDVFRAVIKNAPYGKLAPLAQYKIGLFLKEKGMFQEARDEFEKTINDYPNSEWAKAAKFQIALADTQRSSTVQREQKVTGIALEEFKEFVKTHPDSELTPQAKTQIANLREKEAENNFVIAQYYEKQKNFKSARVYYKDIIAKYADTAAGPRALNRLKVIGDK